MEKDERGKFEPLTDIKPVENANDPDRINLKEKDPQTEPEYLEDNQPQPQLQPQNQAIPKTAPVGSTADYAQFTEDVQPKRNYKKLLLILLATVLVGSAAAYWFLVREKPAAGSGAVTATTSAPDVTVEDSTASTAKLTTISTTTKSYTSANFKLSFSYPDDWVVADEGAGVLTVTSPNIALTNAAGASATGTVVFSIKNHAQKLAEFDKGSATATRDSLKIAYTKPTQSQRGNTYVSYLQYSTTTTAGGLDGLYITGDSGYKKAQNIPLSDVSKVDPYISIGFIDESAKALTIADAMIDTATFADPLINILKSLSIN